LSTTEVWAWVPWTLLALAALGAIAPMVADGKPARDRRRVALVVVGVAGLALALGPPSPIYRLAHAAVPGTSSFRVPARWLLGPAVALPLLAAAGIEAVARARTPRLRPTLVTAAAVGAAGAAAIGWGTGGPGWPSLALGGSAAVLTVELWALARHRTAWAPAAALVVGALAFVELLGANHHASVRWLRMPEAGPQTASEATVALVADARPHRVLSLGRENVGDFAAVSRDLRPNTGGYSGTRSIDGYDGGLVIDRQWAKAMTALTGRADFDPLRMVKGNVAGPFDPRLWDELDTTRVVASHQLSDSEVRTLLPAGSAPIAAGQDLTVWSTPSLGPVFTADGRVPVGLTLRRDPEDPGRLVVDVPNSEARQPIVVSESMATGWTATVVSSCPSLAMTAGSCPSPCRTAAARSCSATTSPASRRVSGSPRSGVWARSPC
jgi:hypothetical protein